MRRNTARYASFAIARLLSCRLREALAFQVRGQRVVVLPVTERRRRSAHRMGREGRPLAARVDAGRRAAHRAVHPGVVWPRLGPFPEGIATELPGTGVALPHGSS